MTPAIILPTKGCHHVWSAAVRRGAGTSLPTSRPDSEQVAGSCFPLDVAQSIHCGSAGAYLRVRNPCRQHFLARLGLTCVVVCRSVFRQCVQAQSQPKDRWQSHTMSNCSWWSKTDAAASTWESSLTAPIAVLDVTGLLSGTPTPLKHPKSWQVSCGPYGTPNLMWDTPGP